MAENKETLCLCAAGDVALGGILEGKLRTLKERRAVVEGIMSGFSGSDIRFLNLDCTFGTGGIPPRPDEYLVSASQGQLELLRDLGIDVVSLANNHSMDYGGKALIATQKHLERQGIAYVGAGVNLAAARQPRIIERNGVRVGFLAYASPHPWVGALPASENIPGVAPLELEMARVDVTALQKQVDCVVVSVHWGKENLHYPPPQNVELGHRLVDWGAGLVLGHHPHVIQGIETYGKGIICYSLGNFLFPDYPGQGLTFNGKQNESLLVRVRVGRKKLELEEIRPVRLLTERNRLELLKGDQEWEVKKQIEVYSDALRKSNYETCWISQVRCYEWQRLRRVFREEIIQAGWAAGIARLLRLGRKNFKSIGRSVVEIITGMGRHRF